MKINNLILPRILYIANNNHSITRFEIVDKIGEDSIAWLRRSIQYKYCLDAFKIQTALN